MASETGRLNGLLDAIAEAAVVAHVQSEQDLAWRDEALKEMAAARDEIRSMIARLTRELEEARELLRELAGGDEAGLAWDRGWRCVYCDSSALYVVSHDGDCPIVRARRALATDMEGQP